MAPEQSEYITKGLSVRKSVVPCDLKNNLLDSCTFYKTA